MSSSPKKPDTQAESGVSHAYGYVTEILGAGEIEGILGGREGIYLNDTPAQITNPITGAIVDNFKGGTFEQRTGTPNQTVIPLFGDSITNEVVVGVELKQATPLIRSINNAELDAIRIRVGVQLLYQSNEGDVSGAEVKFEVFIQQGNGALESRDIINLGGKFTNLTEFEYVYPVDNQGGTISNYVVKLQKISFDAEEDPLVDTDGESLTRVLIWQSYGEIIGAGITYKNSAYVCLGFDAEQFSSIPSRQYLVGGLLFPLPNNSSGTSSRGLLYSVAPWDGSFYKPIAAVADPIWFLYWLLLDKVNGLGEYIKEADIDKWSFYDASVYNNQLVQDGLGGQEHRFLFNAAITNKANAWEVLDQICSSFFARRYWSEGTIKIAQDRPGLVQMQFTNADVEQGQFTYSSTAIDERVNSVQVTWFDPNNLYKETIETIEDVGLIELNGLVTDEVIAVGCTSRGQAIRYGRKIIYSSNLETETVNFTSRAIGEYARIGDLISIADNNRTTARYAGLISRIGGNDRIFFDTPILIPSGENRISVLMPNGSISSHAIASSAGITNFVTITPVFGEIKPNVGANFVITQGINEYPIYRVMSKKVVDDNTSAFELTGMLYDESKYDKIDNGWLTEPTPLAPTLQAKQIAPSSLIAETTVNIDSTVNLNAYWSSPLLANGLVNKDVNKFLISYRLQMPNSPAVTSFTPEISVAGNEYTFANLANDTYIIRIRSLTINGELSEYVYAKSQPLLLITDVARFNTRRYSSFLIEV